MTYLDNQFNYDFMFEVLGEMTANPTEDNMVEQVERLSSVERSYISALLKLNNMTPEQREAWINEGEEDE